ncbi:MAG: DUF4255 domain-containing protein [bacterium]|nr:DUF4255 domain-containing protein [bacterium]
MALGDLNTIGDVTQMIKGLLEGLDVTFDSPATLPTSANAGDGYAAVNLYLYQVSENPHAKNRPAVTRADGVREYPPLALNLYYLLTPYASDPVSAHRVLTHALQLLYVNSTLSGDALEDSVRLSVKQLTINLCQMSLEELTRIWNALQAPYRLSVCYEVRVVLIESLLESRPRRVETTLHVHDQS